MFSCPGCSVDPETIDDHYDDNDDLHDHYDHDHQDHNDDHYNKDDRKRHNHQETKRTTSGDNRETTADTTRRSVGYQQDFRDTTTNMLPPCHALAGFGGTAKMLSPPCIGEIQGHASNAVLARPKIAKVRVMTVCLHGGMCVCLFVCMYVRMYVRMYVCSIRRLCCVCP